MLTMDEAKRAVEAKLRARGLTTRMTPFELLQFCQEMLRDVQFRTKHDPMQHIRGWVERWQDANIKTTPPVG